MNIEHEIIGVLLFIFFASNETKANRWLWPNTDNPFALPTTPGGFRFTRQSTNPLNLRPPPRSRNLPISSSQNFIDFSDPKPKDIFRPTTKPVIFTNRFRPLLKQRTDTIIPTAFDISQLPLSTGEDLLTVDFSSGLQSLQGRKIQDSDGDVGALSRNIATNRKNGGDDKIARQSSEISLAKTLLGIPDISQLPLESTTSRPDNFRFTPILNQGLTFIPGRSGFQRQQGTSLFISPSEIKTVFNGSGNPFIGLNVVDNNEVKPRTQKDFDFKISQNKIFDFKTNKIQNILESEEDSEFTNFEEEDSSFGNSPNKLPPSLRNLDFSGTTKLKFPKIETLSKLGIFLSKKITPTSSVPLHITTNENALVIKPATLVTKSKSQILKNFRKNPPKLSTNHKPSSDLPDYLIDLLQGKSTESKPGGSPKKSNLDINKKSKDDIIFIIENDQDRIESPLKMVLDMNKDLERSATTTDNSNIFVNEAGEKFNLRTSSNAILSSLFNLESQQNPTPKPANIINEPLFVADLNFQNITSIISENNSQFSKADDAISAKPNSLTPLTFITKNPPFIPEKESLNAQPDQLLSASQNISQNVKINDPNLLNLLKIKEKNSAQTTTSLPSQSTTVSHQPTTPTSKPPTITPANLIGRNFGIFLPIRNGQNFSGFSQGSPLIWIWPNDRRDKKNLRSSDPAIHAL